MLLLYVWSTVINLLPSDSSLASGSGHKLAMLICLRASCRLEAVEDTLGMKVAPWGSSKILEEHKEKYLLSYSELHRNKYRKYQLSLKYRRVRTAGIQVKKYATMKRGTEIMNDFF